MLTVDEYKKILSKINDDSLGTLWGSFEESANCVTVPDLGNNRVILLFDNAQDAVMFKLRYM